MSDLEALRVRFCGADGAFEGLVGHDWGAQVAWVAAARRGAQLARRLGILNVPHPARWNFRELRPVQLRRSWYIAAFQLPLLPELAISANDGALLRRVLTTDSPPPAAVVDATVEALLRPGAATAAINYYRAAVRGLWAGGPLDGGAAAEASISLPVRVLWGVRDPYLGEELAAPPTALVPDCELTRLDAGHWVHWDRPAEVNEALLAFLER